jgi:hypothetical protein
LPVGDLLAVCVLGLLGELEFASADFFERVVRGCAFAAAVGEVVRIVVEVRRRSSRVDG